MLLRIRDHMTFQWATCFELLRIVNNFVNCWHSSNTAVNNIAAVKPLQQPHIANHIIWQAHYMYMISTQVLWCTQQRPTTGMVVKMKGHENTHCQLSATICWEKLSTSYRDFNNLQGQQIKCIAETQVTGVYSTYILSFCMPYS